MEVRRMDWLTGPSGLHRNSLQGLNISSIRDFGQIRDPEIPITLRPLIDDTRLKSSYLWVHELLQHVQVHGACDCRFRKKMGRWSCLSLDRTKRSVSTADCKQLIEPEPNWFSIRCNSSIHLSVISSRHSKPPFVHIAAESPFLFLLFAIVAT